MRNRFWLICLMTVTTGIGLARAEGQKSKSGGILTGHLKVTAPYRKAPPPSLASGEKDEYGYGHKSYGTQTHTLPEQVVIYLKKVKGRFSPPTKHVPLDQKYLQFTHRVLPVLRGTTVDFTNHDPVYHNVFTNSQSNKFDLGRKRNGETVSVKMTKSEVPVKVYCEIHAAMKAYVLVLDNPFFTTVGPDQTFEIKGIPPGTYTMVAWHDFWAPVEQKVRIKKGKTTQADVTMDKVQE